MGNEPTEQHPLSTPDLRITELRSKDENRSCCPLWNFFILGLLAALIGAATLIYLTLDAWILGLLISAALGGLLGWIFFALTQEEKNQLKENAKRWKADAEKCRSKTKGCKDAIDWVKQNGKFAPVGSNKNFATAMGVAGGGSIAAAFRLEKLLGLLAQESSFGNNYGASEIYKGPFQLSQAVIDDYNRHNDPDVTFPDDIDGATDFDTAAKVAAWYLAFLMQQLTFRDMQPPITDVTEANKFALAAYNGGLGTIKDAQKKCKDAGKDSSKWENVKDYLPDGENEADPKEKKKIQDKTKEIKDYVDRINEYEKLARELGCVP